MGVPPPPPGVNIRKEHSYKVVFDVQPLPRALIPRPDVPGLQMYGKTVNPPPPARPPQDLPRSKCLTLVSC